MTDNSEGQIDKLVTKAEQFERDGVFEKALEVWRTVLNYRNDPLTLCRIGRAAMKAGKSMEARQAFESALRLDPNLAVAHTYLGMSFRDSGEKEEAARHFRSSASLEASAATYTLLGTVQLQLGRIGEARSAFKQAIKTDPNYEEAFYNLGITFALDHPEKAIKLFAKAVQLDSEYAEAHSELGQALRRINENAQAELHLKKAIELDNTDGWACLYLANILWMKDEVDSAEYYFQSVVGLWPNSGIPLWSLGMFYQYQGRTDEAKIFFQKALSLDPNDIEANKRFAIYLSDVGQVEQAKACLKRALLVDPTDSSVADLLINLEVGIVSKSIH